MIGTNHRQFTDRLPDTENSAYTIGLSPPHALIFMIAWVSGEAFSLQN